MFSTLQFNKKIFKWTKTERCLFFYFFQKPILRGYIPLNFKTLFSSWNVLRHNTYIIVSYKNMKKIKNGTWLSCQSGKTPKKREKLRLCWPWPKYLKEGNFFWMSWSCEWSRLSVRYVKIHNGSFELSGRIFWKFSMFH